MEHLPFLALILVPIIMGPLYGQTHAELTVEPYEASAQPGKEIVFTCSSMEGNDTKLPYLKWSFTSKLHPNLTHPLPNSNRITVINGTLTITNITYDDAGDYQCNDDAGSEPQTAILIVYDMPDYVLELAVVGGICLVLLIILIIGMILLSTQQRRARNQARLINERKKQRKNDQLK